MKTTTSKDGTKLAYDIYGTGPALIMITGASCFRKFMPVESDAKAFAKEFTVYNYDRRGRGDSGNTMPYSVDREVEDIEAMIDAAGGEAYIYGHSSGAVLALEAALKLPKKVKKAIIYDASYVPNSKEKASYAHTAKQTSKLLNEGNNGGAMKYFLATIGMPKFFVNMLPLFPGWKTMKALAPTLMYDIELTKDVPPLNRMAKINVPILISFGAKSPVSLHDVARQLTDVIPNALYEKVEGQDHMVSPKSMLPLFTKFFKR